MAANHPADSALINTLDEAQRFYREHLAGSHSITCHGKPAVVVFERDATHLFSVDPKGMPVGPENAVVRRVPPSRIETRRFDVLRARLMGRVLPAVSQFTVSVPDAGGRAGFQKRVLYGPPLPGSGDRMRVVLRPGPGDAWTCVSAYAVSTREWLAACRLKRAKFPP